MDYQVKTAEEAGWAQISNGELIHSAEQAGYEILLTCDQNVRYQPILTNRKISMIVLGSNIWSGVRLKITEITSALARVSPGSLKLPVN